MSNNSTAENWWWWCRLQGTQGATTSPSTTVAAATTTTTIWTLDVAKSWKMDAVKSGPVTHGHWTARDWSRAAQVRRRSRAVMWHSRYPHITHLHHHTHTHTHTITGHPTTRGRLTKIVPLRKSGKYLKTKQPHFFFNRVHFCQVLVQSFLERDYRQFNTTGILDT